MRGCEKSNAIIFSSISMKIRSIYDIRNLLEKKLRDKDENNHMSTQEQGNLKHGLSNRHIQLIALGGAIGTGLFLGISQSIKLAGPSVILGYAIAGFIAFFNDAPAR